jgi:hypothetical protein
MFLQNVVIYLIKVYNVTRQKITVLAVTTDRTSSLIRRKHEVIFNIYAVVPKRYFHSIFIKPYIYIVIIQFILTCPI